MTATDNDDAPFLLAVETIVAARGAGAGITGRVDRGASLWTGSAAVGVAAPLHRPCADLARPSQV